MANPQSGKAGFTNWAIESTWRTVPITGSAPASLGVASTNPARAMSIDPSAGLAGKPMITTPHNEIDGGIEVRRTIMESKDYTGEYTFKVDPENIYYPLLGLMGKDVQSNGPGAASTQITPTFKHVLQPCKYAPSFSIEDIFGPSGYGRLTSGAIVSKISLAVAKAALTAKVTVTGFRQMPNRYNSGTGVETLYTYGNGLVTNIIPPGMGGDGTKYINPTTNPTFVDVVQLQRNNGPLIFANLGYGSQAGQFTSAFMTVDGVAVNPLLLEGMTIDMERVVATALTGGSGYEAGAVTGGAFFVSGKIPTLFLDNTLQSAAISHSDVGLDIAFNGPYVGSSSQQYSLEIYLPACSFTDAASSHTDGQITVPGDFVCRAGSGGYSALVTLFNTLTNASLGTLAGSTGAAGGLGGWLNA